MSDDGERVGKLIGNEAAVFGVLVGMPMLMPSARDRDVNSSSMLKGSEGRSTG